MARDVPSRRRLSGCGICCRSKNAVCLRYRPSPSGTDSVISAATLCRSAGAAAAVSFVCRRVPFPRLVCTRFSVGEAAAAVGALYGELLLHTGLAWCASRHAIHCAFAEFCAPISPPPWKQAPQCWQHQQPVPWRPQPLPVPLGALNCDCVVLFGRAHDQQAGQPEPGMQEPKQTQGADRAVHSPRGKYFKTLKKPKTAP